MPTPLLLNRHECAVARDGQLIALSPTQFSLLEVLIKHHGSVVPGAVLRRGVWGHRQPANVSASLRIAISELRKKLGFDAIRTVAGFGYMVDIVDHCPACGRAL